MSQLEETEKTIVGLEYATTTEECLFIMNQVRRLLFDPKTSESDKAAFLNIAARVNNKIVAAQRRPTDSGNTSS